MKVLFFIPSFGTGGAERSLSTVASGLAQRGHEVEVVAARRGGPIRTELEGGVAVKELGRRRVRDAIWPLRNHLRTRASDVIVGGMDHGTLGALAASRLAFRSIPVVATFHGDVVAAAAEGGFFIQRHRPLVARWIMRASQASVAVSTSVGDVLRGVAPDVSERVVVIPNPVVRGELFELAEQSVDNPWVDSDRPLVLSVGRLAPPKAIDDLLRAFALVQGRSNARLLVVGDGPLRRDLESLRDELGLRASVKFTGFLPNPYALMRRCDVFVLSSTREGLGNVLIEAGCLGASLVATDCPSGPREILNNRDRSHLVPIGDVTEMAEAIARALQEPRAEPTAQGWERFTEASVVDAYEDLLQGVSSTHGRRGRNSGGDSAPTAGPVQRSHRRGR